MTDITRVAIDTSKSVFTLRAVDAHGHAVLRRNVRRQDVVPFFTKLPPAEVVMEACGGSHHWGRTLQALGHRVRLIPAQYVKRSSSAARPAASSGSAASAGRAMSGCASCWCWAPPR